MPAIIPLVTSFEITFGPSMFWIGKKATRERPLFFREFGSHAKAGKLPFVVREPAAFRVHCLALVAMGAMAQKWRVPAGDELRHLSRGTLSFVLVGGNVSQWTYPEFAFAGI